MSDHSPFGAASGSAGRDSANRAPNVFAAPVSDGAQEPASPVPHHLAPLPVPSAPSAGADPTRPTSLDWAEIADQFPFGFMVFGPGQELLHENDVCRRLAGESVRNAGGIEPWLSAQCLDAGHRDEVINSWRERVWRNQLTRVFTLRGADQTLREIEVRSSLLPDGGITVMLEDATDRVRAEKSHQHGKLKFRALFSKTENGSVLVDRTGRIIDANPAFLELVDMPLRELRLSTFPALLHPQDVEAFAEEEAALARPEVHSDPVVRGEVRLRTRTGERKLQLTYCPLSESGQQASMGLYLFSADDSSGTEELTARLRTVSRKARSLLEAIPDLILLIDPDLTVADFAPPPEPWEEMRLDDSCLGEPVGDSWPALANLLTRFQDQILRGGKMVRGELHEQSDGGGHFSITASAAGDEQMLVVVRRISETPGNGETSEKTPATGLAFDHLPFPVMVLRPDTSVIDANNASLSLLGETLSGLLGTALSARFTPLYDSTLPPCRNAGRLHRSDGEELEVELETFTVPSGGEEANIGVVVAVRSPLSGCFPVPGDLDPASDANLNPLLRELPQHRFRNQIQLVTSLFSLEPQGVAARDAFLKWQIRLRSLACAMSVGNRPLAPVSILQHLAEETCSLTRQGPLARAVKINGSPGLFVDPASSPSLALLFGEMLRLGLGTPQPGPGPVLRCELSCGEDDSLHFAIRPGERCRLMFTDEESETGIFELLTEQMEGRMEIPSRKVDGEWRFVLPILVPAEA